MKTKGTWMSLVTTGVLMIASVLPVQAAPGDGGNVHAVTEASARDVAAWLGQPALADAVVDALAAHPDRGLPLTSVMAKADPDGSSLAARTLAGRDGLVRQYKGLPAGARSLLQVRSFVPAGQVLSAVAPADLWVAVLPTGDDRTWTSMVAYDRHGRQHLLDAQIAPTFPVLIVDIDTGQAVQEGMALINAGLQARGLQSADRLTVTADGASSLDVTRLDRIRLVNDGEPWALGGAEVFAVVSGLQIDTAEPEMATVSLPYLDHDKTDYTPGQPLVIWGNYRFDTANVQLFEDDGDTNYKDLLIALTAGVKLALGAFAPEYAVIADIGGAILKAMPSGWFANDTDYLDSFYLLQRGQRYTGRMGAANNAQVTLSPLTLQ